MKIKFETTVSRPLLEVKDGFDRKLFEALRPPWINLKLKRFDGCSPGNQVHLEMGQLGFYQKWVSLITDEQMTERSWYFIDEGHVLPWPLREWRHRHLVEKISETSSLIVDDIDFNTGSKFMNLIIWPGLWLSFAIRPKVYKKFFEG